MLILTPVGIRTGMGLAASNPSCAHKNPLSFSGASCGVLESPCVHGVSAASLSTDIHQLG